MYPTLLCTVVFYMSRITLRDYTDMSKVLGLDLQRLTNSTQPAFLDFSKPQSWKLDSIFHVYYKYTVYSILSSWHAWFCWCHGGQILTWNKKSSLFGHNQAFRGEKTFVSNTFGHKVLLPNGSSNGQTKIDCRTFRHGVIAWLCNNIGL